MSKYPARRVAHALHKVEKDAADVVAPAGRAHPIVSFRYSYTEISATGSKAHVRSRKTRLEDGKLTSEAFEGELDRSAYDRVLSHVQQGFVGQMTLWLNSQSWLLPFAAKPRPDRD